MTFEDDDRLDRLDDYVSGHLSDAEADAFEQGLFDDVAAGRAPAAVFIDEFAELMAWIARHASFDVGVTRAHVDAVLSSGIPTQYQDFGSGRDPIDIPPLAAGVELFAYRLGVDLRGCTQVDVEVETPDGSHVKTFREVNYDPIDGALYGMCQAPLAELSFRRGRVISRVMATRDGERREVARFDTRPVPAGAPLAPR